MKPGTLWPLGIAVGLGVVVTANMILIHIASANAPVLENEAYYEASLEYQKVIDQREASAALGWTADVDLRDGAVRYRVRDRLGYPVTGLKGEISLSRLDTSAFDTTVTAQEVERGVYVAELDPKLQGYVRVTARFEGGEAAWLDERRLDIP